jgi:hypothetical protein
MQRSNISASHLSRDPSIRPISRHPHRPRPTTATHQSPKSHLIAPRGLQSASSSYRRIPQRASTKHRFQFSFVFVARSTRRRKRRGPKCAAASGPWESRAVSFWTLGSLPFRMARSLNMRICLLVSALFTQRDPAPRRAIGPAGC